MSRTSQLQLNDQRLDQLSMDAPPLPTHRPPTKQEVWERFSFIYQDIKSREELVRFCRDAWCWFYVQAFNFKGWRKQPDWVDGDPVIHEAIPANPFPPDQGVWIREINRLHEIASRAKRVASERRAA